MGASFSLDSRKGQIVLGNKEGSLVINGGEMVMFDQGFVTETGIGCSQTSFHSGFISDWSQLCAQGLLTHFNLKSNSGYKCARHGCFLLLSTTLFLGLFSIQRLWRCRKHLFVLVLSFSNRTLMFAY